MCMLIHHPADAQRFTRAEFDDIYRRNRVGFGIIWRWPSGKISYEKGMWTPDRIWSTYNALYEADCREMVLHWRYATSGARDHANVHPFETVNGVLVAHNGVLMHRSTPDKSDTRWFIEDVLEPSLIATGNKKLNDPTYRLWLAKKLGYGNRIALWPRNARTPTIIAGDRAMVTHRGRLYSNTYAWSAPREVTHQSSSFSSSTSTVSNTSRSPSTNWWPRSTSPKSTVTWSGNKRKGK